MALTLILEDGTGVVGANSYLSESEMGDLAELLGSDSWCNNTNKQIISLIQASSFIDSRYYNRYCGERVSDDQGMEFPRRINGVDTGIPTNFKMAVASLVLQLLDTGSLDLNANLEAELKSESISLGQNALSEKKEYFQTESSNRSSQFAMADSYLDRAMKQIGCGGTNSGIFQFIPAYRG